MNSVKKIYPQSMKSMIRCTWNQKTKIKKYTNDFHVQWISENVARQSMKSLFSFFWFRFCLHDLQETRLGSDCTSSQTLSNPKIRFRGTKKQKLRKILSFSTYCGCSGSLTNNRRCCLFTFVSARLVCTDIRTTD